MTAKKAGRQKEKGVKLKLKKETLKDLTTRESGGKRVKGGGGPATDVLCSRGACGPTFGATCTCGCKGTEISCAGGLCYKI